MINIEEHLGLARKVAFEYYRKLQEKYTYDELESTAYMGLIKAANNFNESKGFKFSTYAIPTIRGEISRMCRDDKWHFKKRGVPHEMLSLNVVVGKDNNIEIQDILEDQEDIEENLINSILVSQFYKLLTKREKQVVYLYYYMNLSQTEIAKNIEISQAHVSRIITDSLKKMKKSVILDMEGYMNGTRSTITS